MARPKKASQEEYPSLELVGYQFPIKITRKGEVFEIYNESVPEQAMTVDIVGLEALKSLLKEILS